MRKETVLSALGLSLVVFCLGNLIAVVLVLEDFLGISGGYYVHKEVFLVLIYLSIIAMICGAIGGYLIGRYIHRALADASHKTT